uniref:Putative ovule protein n=1 Tax=Solanum chacoense TaxID=4108 RepID=A0A0V0GXB9_SOLCH
MEKTYNIYMLSPTLIIISINNKYMDKEIDCFYEKVKYQWFSIASSGNAHSQGEVCLRVLMTTLKRTLSEAKCSTRFDPRFRA